ncbi:metal ABC transporter permease [Vibrio nigripulchritudo]|uniref:metal ABC transporter permease n=1 Tax=Vibrio nigripulchritudo TaxID=28173 RepID=UPI002490C9DE|nr:iron chelate uptake ABC transporter family permease subunit [Vibrio nigripulchritudo]BDU39709.1 zinc ABC transporter permease [Vibrio nigripulchritudo]BDU45432.1 zinc ABC transporter permease [Vibrio nigripulchritudo]
MMQEIIALFTDHTVMIVTLGTTIIGFLAGSLGTFAYLREQSLLGDVVSHASLAGITVAFVIASLLGSASPKSTLVLVPGAIVAGTLAMLFAGAVVRHTKIKMDAAFAVALALFFGGGLTLMRAIMQGNYTNKAGLDSYVFGQAAAITSGDIQAISVLGIVAVSVVLLFWKEFKIYTFDPSFAKSLGFSARILEPLLLSTIVVSIVVGLKAVGIILMIAFVVAPAVAARQWTKRLETMIPLSGAFGAASGLLGTLTSAVLGDMPTGPMIVLFLTFFAVGSLYIAPRRGLLHRRRAFRKKREKLMEEIATEEVQS